MPLMPCRSGCPEFDGPHDAQRIIRLDHVNAPFHRLEIILDPLVIAERVGKHLDAVGMAAGKQVFREDRSIGVHAVRL